MRLVLLKYLTVYALLCMISSPLFAQEHLARGTAAPVISGRSYPGLKKETIDFKGQVTLLDFWFAGCYYYVKANPVIEKLKEKYKGKPVRILGVNASDNTDEKIRKLPYYLSHYRISYGSILVDQPVFDAYMVETCPTFYIIDQKGNIVYGATGYYDDLYDKLSSYIDALLK